MTKAALALHISVGQERRVSRAVSLSCLTLLDVAVVPETSEDVLDDSSVLVCGSLTEDVKIKPKPVVDVLVDGVILGAQCCWVYPLRERLSFCRGAILIRTADIDGWKAPRPAEPGKDVGRL